LWIENTWPKAIHKLDWLIEKFGPVPDWPDKNNQRLTKGIVYYTDNLCDEKILEVGQRNLRHICSDFDIVSVSLKPMKFGRNFVMPLERGILTMFKQILKGLEESKADIVYLCEHDMIYHPSHFDFVPSKKDVYYYNENTWKVDAKSGQALFYYCKQTSGCCAYRELLVEHYRKRVARVEESGYDRNMGFEAGTHSFPRGVDNYKAEKYFSEIPNIDIRHGTNLTRSRWRQDQFRNQKSCLGWTMADEVPGWGRTKDRFDEFLKTIG
jgi:hypothetical protein